MSSTSESEARVADLKLLYDVSSKHSNYQILPRTLRPLFAGEVDVVSRNEAERLSFITDHVDVKGARVLDIGGNTGYFSFELLEAGASTVDFYEGNRSHATFVETAAEVVGLSDRIRVHPWYFEFSDDAEQAVCDVGLLLNVLHHVGDDYGDQELSVAGARANIVESLNRMSSFVRTLVFQLGYNWKGDRTLPLFAEGTKREQVGFVRRAVADYWRVKTIGIAEGTRGSAVYREICEANTPRRDDLGEFLNRPIYIMESKHLTE